MKTRLEQLALSADIVLSPSQVQQLLQHLTLVMNAAGQLNLTSIRESDEALRLHVIDSLLAAPAVAAGPSGDLMDIGTGAGYPGMPLGVVSGRKTTLVEATRKKCAFLEECIDVLGISSIDVCCGRAEELALREELIGCFAVVVSRAVADLPVLLELATPFLLEGGRMVALKGRLSESEIGRGDAAGGLLGLECVEIMRYNLPETGEDRSMAIYARVGEPSVRLPRRPGIPSKRPLG